jgi:long-subunit acyl-CoA synthetase (AMP-forming)
MNLAKFFSANGDMLAVLAHDRTLTYAELAAEVNRISRDLQRADIQRLGLYADNSAAWICVDLACMQANVVLVPIPLFFTSQQIQHLLDAASLDAVCADRKLPLSLPASSLGLANASRNTVRFKLNEILHKLIDGHYVYAVQRKPEDSSFSLSGCAFENSIPKHTAKVTFTSGSTGQPKGVCLSAWQQMQVAKALVDRVNIKRPTHLVALPLSTLLENIAGVYAPLLAQGCVILPSEKQRGFRGSQLVDVAAFLRCIDDAQPNTLITVPELLKVMLAGAAQGWQAPSSFTFIAVGGAKVAPMLMQSARAAGLPVYQGYGLSECGSVISLAGPEDPPGSCGKLLNHVSASIIDGELIVGGSVFLGYLGDVSSWYPLVVATGDLVTFDQARLYVTGRRKQQIINSFGRNIAPEWAESLLLANPKIYQAFVLGEARPYCVAIISLHDSTMTQTELSQWLATVNLQLPDYAKVRHFILLDTPMTQQQGLITANGRLKRALATTYFSQQIDSAYQAQGEYWHAASLTCSEIEPLNEPERIHDTI